MAVKVMASYIDVSVLTWKKPVVLVRKHHAVRELWQKMLVVRSKRKESQTGNSGVRCIVAPQGDFEMECTEWKYAHFQDPTKGFHFLISAVRILTHSP